MSETGDSREITPVDIVVRLRSRATAYKGRPNTATDLFDAADEIERLRAAVDRLVGGMTHPDRCPASYGPMHRCDCGVQKLIDSVLP